MYETQKGGGRGCPISYKRTVSSMKILVKISLLLRVLSNYSLGKDCFLGCFLSLTRPPRSRADSGNSALKNDSCCFYLDLTFTLNHVSERTREVDKLSPEASGKR